MSEGRELRSPLVGAQVSSVPREEPVVAVEIEGGVLVLAVDGLVEVFDDGGSGGLCVLEVGFQVFEEDGEALGSVAELCRGLLSGFAVSSMMQVLPAKSWAPLMGLP